MASADGTSRFDVVVVGGGHAGLLAAAALARPGRSVAVVDADDPDAVRTRPFDGRALALMEGARRSLERHGVWSRLRTVAEPIERVLVEDMASGASVSYVAREIGPHPFGYGIETRMLRAKLLEAAQQSPGVRVIAPARLTATARRPGLILAELEDGRRLAAKLLIGADGRGSQVRTQAGIAVERSDYGQTAITFAIDHARAHGRRVHERLFPQGPLAVLPLRGRTSSITWIAGRLEAERRLALESEALMAELHDHIGDELGGMSLHGRPAGYPLGALHAERYVAPRIALVGDAAHGVHPIHAQGFNMGVADIGALVRCVDLAEARGLDVGSAEVLLPYERARRTDNALTLAMTDGLARLFSNDLLPLKLLRAAGLAALDGVAPLRHLAMRRGMGLLGDAA